MGQPKFNILFPVETINRELDFRLFLAVMFASPGRRFFIGNMDRINRMISGLEGGLYVGKHVFYRKPNPLRFYRRLRENGFTLVYLQEEGGIYPGDADGWRQRLDRIYDLDLVLLQPGDIICNWGEFQNEYYRAKLPQLAPDIRMTGHPRFDLYRPEYRPYYQVEVDDIRARFGDFLLINTNLTLANNSGGFARSFRPIHGYQPDDPKRMMRMLRLWSHVNSVLTGMVCMAHRLSQEFPHLNIVLRPHPSENLDFYRTVFSGVRNIHVEHEGPVGPWLMAAKVLIHDGCTTGVEAHFAGMPIINYKSRENPDYDIRIPNELGLRCRTEDEVIEAVRGLDTARDRFFQRGPSAESVSMLNNFRQEGFAPFLEVLEEALTRSSTRQSPELSMRAIVRRERWAQLRELPRNWTRPISKRYILHRAARQKFYGFQQEIVARKIAVIQDLLQKPVRFQQISDQLLVIESG